MHPRRKPGAEPARLHPRRQPDDPGGVAAMAARDGRRGRRGVSGAGRRPSRPPRCAGRRRRPARVSSPRCRWRASGWPTTCSSLADGRELVLRRWARPGWEADDPDLTAAREALVLERLAGTPVPAPELVAADPDAAACDVPALLITRVPGAPFARAPAARAARRGARRDPRRRPRGRPALPALLRARAAWPCRHGPADREVWERAIALAHAPAPDAARALHPPRLPSGQHAVGGRGADRRGRLDHGLARPGGRRPRPPALEPRARLRPARRRRRPPPPRAPSRTTTSSRPSTSCPTSTRRFTHAELLRLEEHVARALERPAAECPTQHEGRLDEPPFA